MATKCVGIEVDWPAVEFHARRQEATHAHGRGVDYQVDTSQASVRLAIIGAAGEYAWRQYLGLAWPPVLNASGRNDGKVDLRYRGYRAQCKTTEARDMALIEPSKQRFVPGLFDVLLGCWVDVPSRRCILTGWATLDFFLRNATKEPRKVSEVRLLHVPSLSEPEDFRQIVRKELGDAVARWSGACRIAAAGR